MIFSKLIEFFALCIIAFTPIALHPSFGSLFGTPKLVQLRFFSFIILLLFILKYYFNDISDEKDKIDKAYNFPFIFLLIILLFSSFFSISPILSFFGEYHRFDGYLTILNYIFVYFVFYLYICEKKNYERFVSFLIYPSVIVIAYGLLQAMRFDFIVWDTERPTRIFSTLGHPIFLATYLSLIFPFALFRFFFADKFYQKTFYFIYLVASYIAIIFTLARSGWLALAVSLIIFFIFTGYKEIKKNIYKIFILFASIILTTFVLNAPPHSSGFSTVSQRAISIVKVTTDSSIKERWNIYETTLRIIRKYPLFGTGPETLKDIFTVYRNLKFISVSESNVVADRAHNEFLHIAATSGLLGLFAYLWVFVLVFLFLLYKIKKTEDRFFKYFLICCLSSFCGFLTSSFFAFGVVSTYIIFYAIIGAGMSVHGLGVSGQKLGIKKFSKIKILSFPFVILFWFFLVVKFVVHPAAADYYYFKARVLNVSGNSKKAIISANKAMYLNPYQPIYLKYTAALYYNFAIRSNPPDEKYLKSSIKTYQRYLTMRPFDAEGYLEMGKILQSISYKNKKIFEDAILFYEKAHSLYPEFVFYSIQLVDVYFKHYRQYKNMDYLNKGWSILNILNDKYPNTPEILFYLGKYSYLKGDLPAAEKYIKKAIKKNPNSAEYKVWLGNIYLDKGKYKEAIMQFEDALKYNPVFPAGVYNQLGIAYKMLQDISKAKQLFQKAIELEPRYTGAINNLREIEK